MELKKEFPELTRQLNDEVFKLNAEEYEETINRWADDRLNKLQAIAAEDEKTTARKTLLNNLGITEEQAKLLLS